MPIFHHNLSNADREANLAFRAAIASHPPLELAPASRPFFDAFMQSVPVAPDVSFEEVDTGTVKGVWCRPARTVTKGVILYFHGGGYTLGSAAAYRHVGSQFAARTGAAVFVSDYALAPERPFPAAHDDAMAAYLYLRQEHEIMTLAGDSAGGGLALSLLLPLSRMGLQAPAAVAVMSPWTDMTLTNDSLTTRAGQDPLLSRAQLYTAAANYYAGHDRNDPRMSPIHGVTEGMPPVLIHVGNDEVLRDDTARYVEAMDACGNVAEGHIWDAMTHVFPTNFVVFDAAEIALASICSFLSRHLDDAIDLTI